MSALGPIKRAIDQAIKLHEQGQADEGRKFYDRAVRDLRMIGNHSREKAVEEIDRYLDVISKPKPQSS